MPSASGHRRGRALLLTDEVMVSRDPAFAKAGEPWATRVVFAIRAIAQRINDDANVWLAPHGLTAAKYNYLVVLYTAEKNALSLNDLATLIHTSNASVTGIVDSLERDGFLERVRHPDDRRSVIARLTPKGKAVFKRAYPAHHDRIETIMGGLSRADRKSLMGLLAKIAEGLEAQRELK